MARPAPEFKLSEDELFELQNLAKAFKTPQQTVVRINIILDHKTHLLDSKTHLTGGIASGHGRSSRYTTKDH